MHKPHQSALRWRILTPVVLLVIATVASLGAAEEIAARRQADALVTQRGETVLSGITDRLQERQRAKEAFAQLLAATNGLGAMVEARDVAGLRALLVPLQAKAGIDRISVYGPDRQPVVRIGNDLSADNSSLVQSALSGETRSAVAVVEGGLSVGASAPIASAEQVVGELVIASLLDESMLNQLRDRDSVEISVFRGQKLVATSARSVGLEQSPSLPNALQDYLAALDSNLAAVAFKAVSRQVGRDGTLVALVPVDDLYQAAQQRQINLLLGILLLVGALSAIGLILARDIVRPLEAMVATTRDIVRGNYQRRIPQSNIRELTELADAINSQAEQIEAHIGLLTEHAYVDPLTKLPNRACFKERLEEALVSRTSKTGQVAVVFLDLDNFKYINDSLGHETGDQLLVAVAERIRLCVRDEDIVARFGGDEFTILLENVTAATEAIAVADRIADRLVQSFEVGPYEVFTTASLGFALSGATSNLADDLLREADIAMYRAKSTGKAHYEIFDQSMNHRVAERLQLETDLRWAVERGELRVYYQPIVHLDSGVIQELEALVRWEHPTKGMIQPNSFIPIAEETGMILPIGRFVLEQACRQTREWHQRYRSDPLPVISVNLSGRQFQQPKLVQDIAKVLEDTGLDAKYLKLEITESVMMHDAEVAIRTLRQLKDLGIRIAIDDFGTGYSSLAYLKRFPLDTLKVDRAFIKGIDHDADDSAIVRSIIALAKTLNLSVTGEGVETSDQLDHLRTLGCDRGQGFYFNCPMPSAEIDTLFRKANVNPFGDRNVA